MNSRELSEKLESLADQLGYWFNNDEAPETVVFDVMQELRKLSNQTYAPGNGTTWDAIKPKPVKPQGGFISQSGKKSPF